ncbi:MAG: type III pantothenate kinase [Ardenticatenaceae bacterium]|nr:type III pantothenate kinase [Ardenticatenaceae bacterium]HBY93826.1 type III pantothenate kinase [Chloroflexota bacterium]
MLILTIDVGNTHAKFGVYDGPTLRADWRAVTDHNRTPDEWAVLLDRFLALRGLQLADLAGCVLASVVPVLTAALREMVVKYLGVEPLVVGPGIDVGIAIERVNPQEVGADRVVNALAARERYGAPCIVMDFGTATTFDVVSPGGAYIGGVIAPGLNLSVEALVQHAARLYKVELAFPPAVIGNSTVTAMQSGLMWGYVSLVDGIARRIQAELGQPAAVVATGGLAEILATHSETIQVVDPELTIHGLYRLWELNRAEAYGPA